MDSENETLKIDAQMKTEEITENNRNLKNTTKERDEIKQVYYRKMADMVEKESEMKHALDECSRVKEENNKLNKDYERISEKLIKKETEMKDTVEKLK